MTAGRTALAILALNTLSFGICFAAWMLNGVLVTFLVDEGVYRWSESQVGVLIGIPVLTGSVARLPVGILTDRFGGRVVFSVLMVLAAIPMYGLALADSYASFAAASLGFGLTGASFAVGIASTSLFFRPERQGTALGIFGIGNAGAALTNMVAPVLLVRLTDGGTNLDAWRALPKVYAAALALTGIAYFVLARPRVIDRSRCLSLAARLRPLEHVRVWRFALYYFLVAGGFIGLSQWLVPYYVNVYGMTVATAGLLAATFSLPLSLVRALGGWLSDRFGARRVMYAVFGTCTIGCSLLAVPRMDIESPGRGVAAGRPGVVTSVAADAITVEEQRYLLRTKPANWPPHTEDSVLVLPTSAFWQDPVVAVGDRVDNRQLIARGITHIYFQANVRIFTALVLIVGFAMGLGMAAVFKHIPDYFPHDLGVVGGIVGVIGGLGGFFCPILFGALLERFGLWTTCWMFFAVLSLVCLAWMHLVIRRMEQGQP